MQHLGLFIANMLLETLVLCCIIMQHLGLPCDKLCKGSCSGHLALMSLTYIILALARSILSECGYETGSAFSCLSKNSSESLLDMVQ